MPLTQLLSKTDLSPPLISLATLSSFPPGEAKGCKPLACTLYYGGLYKTGCDCHSSDCTPSVSFAASSPRGGAKAASPLAGG